MLSASAASRWAGSSKYSSGSTRRHAMPDVGCVAAAEEADLRVVGVMVAEAGGEPGARLVERRGDEAAPGRRPLGDAPLGLLLQRLELRGHVRVVGRIGGQRPGRSARGASGPNEMPTSVIETPTPGAGKNKRDLEVVLQVLADVRRVELTRDAHGLELGLRSDAGQQEQVRRPDRAAAQHDLLVGECRARRSVRSAVLDAACPSAPRHRLEEHPRHVGVGDDREVRSLARRRPRGTRGRCSTACRPGWWSAGATRHRRGHRGRVRCSHRGDAGRHGGVDELLRAGEHRRAHGDAEGTGGVVRSASITMSPLGASPSLFLKYGSTSRVAPTGGALRRPAVEVAGMAAHVRHVVDPRRPAEHLAPRHHHPPVGQPEPGTSRHRRCTSSPSRVPLKRGDAAGIDSAAGGGPPASTSATVVRVLGEPSRDHRSRGPATDHDEIEGFACHSGPLFSPDPGAVPAESRTSSGGDTLR